MNLDPPAWPRALGEDPTLFHAPKGVRAGLAKWQLATECWLKWFGVKTERAERLPRCGTGIQVPVCKQCGVEDRDSARRTADCEMRICPRCARQKAQERRACIRAATERLAKFGKSGGWFLHTIPVPRVHAQGTNIARLKRDFETAWAAWRCAWKFLQGKGAQLAYASVECAPGGLVHVHVLVWHKWLSESAFTLLRERVLSTLRRHWHPQAQQLNVQKVGNGKGNRSLKGAIKEVAKYVTKGVAIEYYDRNDNDPWQTHPALAAQVEIAWKGRRLWRVYGEALPEEKDIPAEKWVCPNCGHCDHRLRYELPQEASDSELASLIRSLSLAAATVVVDGRQYH